MIDRGLKFIIIVFVLLVLVAIIMASIADLAVSIRRYRVLLFSLFYTLTTETDSVVNVRY